MAGINLKRCSGCKSVRYCGPRCQSREWKLGLKTECVHARAATAASAAAAEA